MKTKSTFFCLVFAVCANINITAQAQVNVQDSLALVDLYNSTDGPNWRHQDNWLIGPVSTWERIKVKHERVTEVHLYNNRLKGSIPSSLGNLGELQYMTLTGNELT